MQASAPVAEEVQPEPVKEEKQTRPLSLMVRAMSSGVGKPTTPSFEVGPAQDTAESTETKAEKRVSMPIQGATDRQGSARILAGFSIPRLRVVLDYYYSH